MILKIIEDVIKTKIYGSGFTGTSYVTHIGHRLVVANWGTFKG
jgi:hypothetical protein